MSLEVPPHYGPEARERFIRFWGPRAGLPAGLTVAQAISLQEQAKACDYRGPRTQTGCTCLNVCYAGTAGRGRKSPNGDYHEATIGECVECVQSPAWPARLG